MTRLRLMFVLAFAATCYGAQADWQMPAVKVPQALTSPVTTAGSARLAPWAWYDAANVDNFVFTGEGGVAKWLDSGAQKHDAAAYKVKQAAAEDPQVYATWGETNGVPALLMGAYGNNVDLSFTACSDIKTVFAVVDLARRSFLLAHTGYYDFHRMGSEPPSGSDSNRYGLFNTSSKFHQDGAVVRLNGETVRYDTPVFPGTRYLIAVVPSSDARASCFSNDRGYTDNNNRTGGRALSELVIFNRTLSATEFAEVESYLGAKWFGATTNLTTAANVGTGLVYPNLTVADGASFVFTTAALDAEGPAVNVMGTLAKTTEKIVISWQGVLPTANVAKTLLSCAGGTLTRADFDCRGFPADAEIAWTGTELTVVFPGKTLIPSALVSTSETVAPRLWLDAASSTNFVFTADGGVETWLDRSVRHNNAEAFRARPSKNPNPGITYGTWGVTNGVTAYLMGPRQSLVDLQFTRLYDIRTVFTVVDIDRRCFLLADSAYWHFHRQSPGEALIGNDDSDYGLFAEAATPFAGADAVRRVFGEPVRRNYPLFPGTRYLVSLVSTEPAVACRLATDRFDEVDDRTGGRALSELIVFNRELSTDEIVDIENYLGAKWFGATTNLTAEAVITKAGATYPNLTVDAGGALTIDSATVVRDQPCVKVYGTLRKGTADKIRIGLTGTRCRATLLTCAASDGLTADDFELTGVLSRVKPIWDGTTLSLPPMGLVLLFR